MKVKRFLMLALLIPSLFLAGCGNTMKATRIIEASDVYSRREIVSAMRVVAQFFSLHYDGCTLQTICYEEDPENPPEDARTIRLYTSFETGPHTEGSLSPNEVYSRYSWELERGIFGGWKLTNWGYG